VPLSDSQRFLPTRARPELIRLYLQDHFAGLTGTLALARRAVRNHRSTALGPSLAELADEMARDRATINAIMDRLDVHADRLKEAAALSAERVGRFKLNGSVFRRSPLSTLVELEALRLGLCAKEACLVTVRRVADSDPRLAAGVVDELIGRARRQLERLEELRGQAAAEAFGLTDWPR
jgi:hypothetical protein